MKQYVVTYRDEVENANQRHHVHGMTFRSYVKAMSFVNNEWLKNRNYIYKIHEIEL